MFVHQSRRQMLKAFLGTLPLAACFYFWRSAPSSTTASGVCDVVIVDGWILRREDLKRARIDAT
jgi:hypothetical protein